MLRPSQWWAASSPYNNENTCRRRCCCWLRNKGESSCTPGLLDPTHHTFLCRLRSSSWNFPAPLRTPAGHSRYDHGHHEPRIQCGRGIRRCTRTLLAAARSHIQHHPSLHTSLCRESRLRHSKLQPACKLSPPLAKWHSVLHKLHSSHWAPLVTRRSHAV